MVDFERFKVCDNTSKCLFVEANHGYSLTAMRDFLDRNGELDYLKCDFSKKDFVHVFMCIPNRCIYSSCGISGCSECASTYCDLKKEITVPKLYMIITNPAHNHAEIGVAFCLDVVGGKVDMENSGQPFKRILRRTMNSKNTLISIPYPYEKKKSSPIIVNIYVLRDHSKGLKEFNSIRTNQDLIAKVENPTMQVII